MFLALSRFVLASDSEEAVRDAFRERPHRVDAAAGFVRMEVVQPDDNPREFWLLTWWEDEASFEHWYASHAWKASHEGIPEGLRLVPGETTLRRFRRIAD